MSTSIRPEGRAASLVLAELADLRTDDLPTHGGTTTAYVFDAGIDGLDDLAARAHTLMATVNGLDPTRFPSVARLENDLVAAVAPVLGGDSATVGSVTSGGTESCLLAVLGARERWRSRGGSGRPELVVPATVHAAFHKAAHLFDLDLVRVPVDPVSQRADAGAMAAALSTRTAMVVASAPSYAYGVIDPVRAIAAAALERDIPCHVDACMGGWVVPFLRRAGVDGPDIDFTVPGVTSISVDLHKYGYVPKGVSVLLHRDAELRLRHWFAVADWPGYPVVNPTLASSRPVGPMAAAWAVMRHLGIDGYSDLALATHAAAKRLAEGVLGIDGLHVVGAVDTTLVAIADDGGPDDPDIKVVVDEAASRGWFLQVQPAFGAAPTTAHATVTAAAAGRIDDAVDVLRDSAVRARAVGRVSPDPRILAAARRLDPSALEPRDVADLLRLAGVGDGLLPGRMAAVHALIEALPAPLAQRLVAEVVSRLLTPPSEA